MMAQVSGDDSAKMSPPRPTVISARANPPSREFSDESLETENMDDSNITDEDAQSLIELSISPVATRLKSPKTPALEKAAAMEELEGGAYFDSDPDTPHVPTIQSFDDVSTPKPSTHVRVSSSPITLESISHRPSLPTGKPSSSDVGNPELPAPWNAGPKPLIVSDKEDAPAQSSLHGVFDTSRTRSLSAGAEALRKLLPKGLPSMAQVGNLFGSSSSSLKTKVGGFSNLDSGKALPSRIAHITTPAQNRSLESSGLSIPSVESRPDIGLQRPKYIRRVTSDHSLLYHSLSRASSLGDDARFENHHNQVNSRAKAIRDSLQDRSSFRMPQMPSMPSLPRVPSFNFNKAFLSPGTSLPARWRIDTDGDSDILQGSLPKTKSVTNLTNASGAVGAAVSRPEAAFEAASRLVGEGPSSSSFDRALGLLTGDVVIMGGYRGSVLRSTKTNRQVWVPVKVGLNLRKVDLEVGLDPEDEERMEEKIYPSGMLQNIGPVDISKRLISRLSESENARKGKLRVWDYGYDWRLSPHILSRKLTAFLENLPSNKNGSGNTGALVIAHSLGGLITRHVVNERPDLFKGVIYAGVPQSCVNILGPLRNGDAVLLSSRVLTAQVNFTLRTSFLLLPEEEDAECFFDLNTKEKYPVDFFSVNDWIKYRFSPCTDPPLPPKLQPSRGIGSLLNMSTSLLNLPISGKKSSSGNASPPALADSSEIHLNENKEAPQSQLTKTPRVANVLRKVEGGTDRTLAPQMGSSPNPVSKGQNTNQSVSTAVTIPRDKAIAYLRRTLAETKKFKKELHFKPELSTSNRYPPLALIYGKSIPTVFGAKVDGRDGIPCSDVYDNLAFASGDGVCLARQAMLPDGYQAVNGGRISSDRGHITLLGDLNAVGRAIEAVWKGRERGIGLGVAQKPRS